MVVTRSYGGIAAEVRRADREQRLVAAAVSLMGEHGVGGLTVRNVADAADVSPRYLYESFADLADLRRAAFDATAAAVVRSAVDALAAAPPTLPAQIGAVIEAMLRHGDEHPAHVRLVLTDSFGDPDLTVKRHEMAREFARVLAGFLRPQLAPGSTPRLDLATRMLVGATAEIVVARSHDPGTQPLEQLAADMRDLFLGMLAAAS